MYPFLTLDDHARSCILELLEDGSVKVYIEKAGCKDGFHLRHAFCQNTAGKMFPASLSGDSEVSGHHLIVANKIM